MLIMRMYTCLFALVAGPVFLQSHANAQTLSLSRAEKMALVNNHELRMLRAERELQTITERERLREFFPSVSLSYRQNRSVAQRNFDNGQYSVQLSLSQPVYNGGRTILAYEIAGIDRKLAGEKYVAARNQLQFQVREAYLKLQQGRANISVARAGVVSANFLYRKALIENRQGSIPVLDLLEIKNERERRKLSFERETQTFKDGMRDFAVLLEIKEDNLPPLTWLDLFKLKVPDLRISAAELYKLALRRHRELRQIRMDLLKSRKEFLITKYSYLPNVAITGRYGRTGDEWPPRVVEWGLGINFTFNLFGTTLRSDATSNRARSDTSRGLSAGGEIDIYSNPGWRKPHLQNSIALKRARRRLFDLKRTVRLEVQRQIQSLNFTRRELRVADEGLAVREQRFRIEQLRHRRGELSLSRLLEEELKLINARLGLVQQRIGFALTVNRLELSLGLPLDSLNLIDYGALETSLRSEEIIKRSWKPRTNLKTIDDGRGSEPDVRPGPGV